LIGSFFIMDRAAHHLSRDCCSTFDETILAQ
jgi:hypothetical protein